MARVSHIKVFFFCVLSGGNPPLISVAASQAQFQAGSAGGAVIARFDVFPDALAGIPLALKLNGPLLLCSNTFVDGAVQAELSRAVRSGSRVYLLGGTAGLSDAVKSTIEGLGFPVTRVAGADRFETAVRVAEQIGPARTAFVVNGMNFPDALAAGAAAAAVSGGAHILLATVSSVPAATKNRLASGGYTSVVVFGGVAAISDATYASIRMFTHIQTPFKNAYKETLNKQTNTCIKQCEKSKYNHASHKCMKD